MYSYGASSEWEKKRSVTTKCWCHCLKIFELSTTGHQPEKVDSILLGMMVVGCP